MSINLLLKWADTLFLISIIFLVIGGSLYVVQGGFFNAFIHSFRRLLKGISKIEQVIEEIEGKEKGGKQDPLPYAKRIPLTNTILLMGIILFLISIGLSYLYTFL